MPLPEYRDMAALVASKLTREELVKLAALLDEDSHDTFCHCIQAETAKIAPELYVDPNTENEG